MTASAATIHSERTPLLSSTERDSSPPTALTTSDASTLVDGPPDVDPPSPAEDDEDRPLPLWQMFLLCFARLVEPVAFFSIFPFVSEMIHESGSVPDAEVGFWSGWIESCFSLTQTVFMLFWGRASDKYGRKPVLIASLSGVAVASVLFGLSKSVWQMIALRSVAGIFAGTIVTVRTMITENSTQKTQARAFSFFAFAGNIGIFLGPVIGGGLSKPATQLPAVFGGSWLLREYPYLLPCLISGGLAAVAAVINLIWLKETRKLQKDHHAIVLTPPSMREVVSGPGVIPVLCIFEYALLLGVAFTAMCPVFFYTPIELGGYNFTPPQISLYLAIAGISQAIWLLLVFPPLVNRIGTGKLLRLCACAWPITFMALPLMNILLRHGQWTAFWVIMPMIIITSSGVSMAFTAVQLALNDISPNPLAHGTLNGVALSLQSAVRAVAPATYNTVYAIGVERQILWGELGFAMLIVTAFGFIVLLKWLPEQAEGRPKKKADEETQREEAQ
ncbi:MFS general substrate transporter [Dacryopinax primogenitus]|uniref:MFS general substrate transporter n=1 Tax=Dacryopinax primogenitus (strain DJM 731) TaxID=1858805 RepID=M5G8B8_DACPD|nr:MFS general substrate transporter [Dacryopinax primogenitus]EJU00003.1 MFS general substrate transporter [Dacryopinax primogenitus]